ncbi:hypothetical protein GBN32_15025 [Plesiomonas shigelloides]|uniref:hypothetical protein n=1 Tax=Plesiomonas shigelloides TaxID=703 RepID=UPI0012629146|nr:hypothetical protein [Plesiomonas shigelloides]KAB7706411.1 hypothetical protein GBN32_15025 [Plesiomonas shigelloides]
MKKRYIVLGVVGFGIFYVSRPWLPMLYLWGNSIEVEINTPAHLVPSVGGSYSSSSCQSLSMSSGNWIDERRGGDAKLEKISDTQYRAKVYYQDFGPCNWQLDSVGWTLEYKNAGTVLTGATSASAGGNTVVIGSDAYFDDSDRNSSLYSDNAVFTINQTLVPYILSADAYMGYSFYMENKDNEIDTYYYNPYKSGSKAKIIYNVTVDESSLKGLTADEAYRIQEERLAREKKEKIEKEAARRKAIRDEIDENRRQREEREALEAKNQLSK